MTSEIYFHAQQTSINNGFGTGGTELSINQVLSSRPIDLLDEKAVPHINGSATNDYIKLKDVTAPEGQAAYAFGNAGNDTLIGSPGADGLSGGEGSDSIEGGVGNDTLDGGEGDPSGNDTLDGGDGDDWFYAAPGNDSLNGGKGFDAFEYQLRDFDGYASGTSQTLDGGENDSAPAKTDLIFLPGSANDYDFSVSFGFTWHDTTTTIETNITSFYPAITLTTRDIERVSFEEPVNNGVGLKGQSVIAEMAQLADEAYNTDAKSAEKRGWHAVSALEMGIKPASFDGGVVYRLDGGLYSATSSTGNGAAALVLIGMVEGKRTLAISFRGTDDLSSDIWDYLPFYNHYDAFAPLILALKAYTSNPANDVQQVLITGHSLGGAMVQHLMFEGLTGVSADNTRGFTWGSPGAEPTPSNKQILNFAHVKDIVPDVPFTDPVGASVETTYSGAPDVVQAHKMTNYIGSTELLIQFASDSGSPFHTSAIAQALRGGGVPSGGNTAVWLGSNSNDHVQPGASDNWVLAGGGNDEISLEGPNLVATSDFRIIDGGLGDDTLHIKGGYGIKATPVGSGFLILDGFGGPIAKTARIEKVYIEGELIGPDGKPVSTASAPTSVSLSGTSVAENSASGRTVGVLSTADAETDDTHNYTLVNNGGGRFSIEGNSLVVAKGFMLDYEQASSYEVVIRSTDRHGQSIDQAIRISVTDIASEKVVGTSSNDVFFGGRGKDNLNGGAGNDKLRGGKGIDTFTGGKGKDAFIFDDGDTGSSRKAADYILDFSGRNGDRMDLKLIDANTRVKGDQKFSFIGEAAFTKAGQVRYEQTAKETYIAFNTDADRSAEGVIRLKGSMDLSKGWFLL
ncbi:hypothetical protein BB934_45675 (plasmid) [Microvirga ossetica]|uniref:Cadherin domain-containing protein n=1 Tax=Microvirga ossetica TaxID=1882682 RepID=A0A1B2EZZ6_9HYPH|nr:hypothetical protein BB934_45675 [Microvirga ossetica]